MPHASREEYLAYRREWDAKNKERLRAIRKREREKLKADTITAYGGKCECCGEEHLVFLTIDHPDGDGAEKRRTEGHRGGTQQYRRLRAAGFPPGYRVLCWNCNAAEHILGACPHRTTA